jgi:hypothetical protein
MQQPRIRVNLWRLLESCNLWPGMYLLAFQRNSFLYLQITFCSLVEVYRIACSVYSSTRRGWRQNVLRNVGNLPLSLSLSLSHIYIYIYVCVCVCVCVCLYIMSPQKIVLFKTWLNDSAMNVTITTLG